MIPLISMTPTDPVLNSRDVDDEFRPADTGDLVRNNIPEITKKIAKNTPDRISTKASGLIERFC